MAKVVSVIGVDSMLGGAVAKALTSRFKVRGVFLGSGLSGTKKDSLTDAGVELVDGSSDLQSCLAGSHGCFITLQTEFKNPDFLKKEINLGKNIADLCKKNGVQHVVFESKLSPVRILGVAARHMDGKAEVEDYMRSLDLPLTCIICPLLYQQFLTPPTSPRRIDHFSFALELPIGTSYIDLIDADDTGRVVTEIFHQGTPLFRKTLILSGDKLTVKEIAARFSASLAPRVFIDKIITIDQFRNLPSPGSADLACMFDFYLRVDQRASIDATKRLYPALQTLDTWLQKNSHAIAQLMDRIPIP